MALDSFYENKPKRVVMENISASAPRQKLIPFAVWPLRLLLGLAFLAFAAMKLTGQPEMVAEFEQIGLGQWFRILTGILEVVGGIAILIPPVSVLGALLLLAIDAGAFVAQITVLHVDWIHTVVLAAVIVLLIYLQRGQLKAILDALAR